MIFQLTITLQQDEKQMQHYHFDKMLQKIYLFIAKIDM